MELKDYMTEEDMEHYLLKNNYEVSDDEGCIDSTLVIETAILLGFESVLEDDKEYLEFYQIGTPIQAIKKERDFWRDKAQQLLN
jgi:hypothetical protein